MTGQTFRSGEELPEPWEDFIADVGERLFVQKRDGGVGDAERPRGRLVDAFREAKVGLELGLALAASASPNEAGYLIARLVRSGVELDKINPTNPRRAPRADEDDDELAMLVANVEVMEDAQRVVGWIPSLIRLYEVESFSDGFANAGRDLRVAHTPSIGRQSLLKDREVGGLAGRLRAGRDYKLPREMIQGRPEVVDRVPEDRREVGIDGWNLHEAEDIVRSLMVVLSDNGLSARSSGPFGHLIEVRQMGLCSPQLGVNAFQ